MSTFEDPELVRNRRSMFAKFAKLKAIQEEKDRLESDTKHAAKDAYYNPWMTEKENDQWKREQLEYTIPYRAEFEVTTASRSGGFAPKCESDVKIRQNGQEDRSKEDECHSDQQTNVDSSAGSTVKHRRDIMAQLKSLRGGRLGARRQVPRAPSCINDFERTSTILPPTEKPIDEFNTNISTEELYKNYFSRFKNNTSLPIYRYRDSIVNSINSYSVILIEGATGCGKTTQVPLYILEDAIINRRCKKSPVIYVTQPRRIAARSIAERVCFEHNWELGSVAGYQVSLEKKVQEQTVLVFCTAGVLLQKLIQEKSLQSFTHIIIDEAHERDADTDLLLMMIRTLMRKEMPFFRLIVMSATMDAGKLKKYFTFRTNYGHQAVTTPSTIEIPYSKVPSNSVQIVHFDKLKSLFGVDLDGEIPEFDYDNPELHDICLKTALKIILQLIPNLDTYSDLTKSTLVFLPGYAEISKLDRMLRVTPGVMNHLDIIPLHSCLTVADQIRVFQPARKGCRKVILATNIAESSITVPDVGFIIDFCLTKTLVKDNITRFPTLKLLWSSQDKCTQRSGRTGRCCAGKVFRMVPTFFYEKFKKFADPELLTAPLELSVLRVKNFQMGELQELFSLVLDPPPFNEIRTAVLELKQIGALSSTYKCKISDTDGDLTELGKIISALPIDVRLSKLIVLASVFDVIEGAIVVAACLSTNRTVVRHSYGNSLDTYENKLEWANGSNSDLFVNLDVFDEFRDMRSTRGKSDHYLTLWCQRKGLDERKLYDVDALVTEIKDRLMQINITSLEQPNRERDLNMDSLMLKMAFCASFYPNYFITRPFDVQYVRKDLCGLDPTKTVIMHNIPVNNVPLYRTQIMKQVTQHVCEDVDFIADCSKALLVLNDDTPMTEDENLKELMGNSNVLEPSTQVHKSVYRALKLGETGDYIFIREFKEMAAHQRMQYYNDQRESICKRLGQRLIPSWYKIVEGPADNNRLFDADPDEFDAITKGQYYVELEFNSRQDQEDQHELYELELYEKKGNRVDHHIFKNEKKRIRGPDSPIRMTFSSVLEKSKGFMVDIDSHSVNSILLDPDYGKERRQLLVAASVTQTKRNRVMARDTTLMPNIRGLPTLMALLYAQYYKLIYNEQMKCIAGAVFGIGWNELGQPIDRLYEVDLAFDVLITLDDIQLINKARERISELLKFTEIQSAGKPQAQLQCQLRDIILALMRKRRYPLIEVDVCDLTLGVDFHVDEISPEENPILEGSEQTRPFLPRMKLSRHYTELDTIKAIRANLDQLGRINDGIDKAPRDGLRCLVCGNGVKCFLLLYMRIINHVLSESHVQKVKEFEEYERLVVGRVHQPGTVEAVGQRQSSSAGAHVTAEEE